MWAVQPPYWIDAARRRRCRVGSGGPERLGLGLKLREHHGQFRQHQGQRLRRRHFGDTAAAADEDAEDYSIGKTVRDESLPYPYQFPDPNKKPVAGETMRVAVSFDFANFDPTVSSAGGTITVPNHVHNRLIGMKGGPHKDPFLIELEPELASSWERTPDGQTFTFNIRNDIAWQNLPPLNGRPFVAADVKYAYDRYAETGVHRSYWRNISSTETPDDTTFKATMGTVTADFILPLASRYQTIFPRETVDAGNIDTVVVGTGSSPRRSTARTSPSTRTRNTGSATCCWTPSTCA